MHKKFNLNTKNLSVEKIFLPNFYVLTNVMFMIKLNITKQFEEIFFVKTYSFKVTRVIALIGLNGIF